MSRFDEGTDLLKTSIAEKFPSTKAELVAFYQAKFPGQGKTGWKQQLIHDLLPYTPQTGKDPAKNLGKRFEPSRINNVPRRGSEKAQYTALGKQVAPIPASGVTITISGDQSGRDREWSADFSPGEMADFADNPSLKEFFQKAKPDWHDAVDTLFPDSDNPDDDSGALANVNITIG